MSIESEVARTLLEIGAVGFNPQQPITFKSGIKSPIYVDNRRLPFHPAHWRIVIDGFRTLIEREHIQLDVVAGIEAAGIPHSSALAYSSGLPSVFVRKQPKEHGTRSRIEGGDVANLRVLLVEDLVTTGGSSLSGVAALREAGADVEDCFAIISYGFTEARMAFAEADVRLHTLTSFDEILKAAGEAIDQVTIRDWLRDPYGWAGRQGLA
jgi:orotate phosphoribosyltransferase